MLDDLKFIHQRDSQDAFGVAAKQWQQYKDNFGFNWQPPKPISNVVVAGMGGSGLAAKVAMSWPGLNIPFEVVQDYEWPNFITENTLLICCSYSGNTEEEVSLLNYSLGHDFPEKFRPMIIVISSGGQLLTRAKQDNIPFIQLMPGLQPRATLGYQLKALVQIFEQLHLIVGAVEQIDEAGSWLQEPINGWLPTVPAHSNQAKQIAQELMGKSIVVYSGASLFPAAYKWKISFNENAKHIAWCNQLPEADHNEILGWTEQPVQKPYSVIDIRSNLDNERVKKRFLVTDKLLSGKRPSPIIVEPQGQNLIQQLVWTIALGDFVSLYLAMLNNVDPTPVDLIEKLKTELGN